MISKTTFRQALLTATEELANEQQRDIIFAAPLALRVLERLKRAIGEEKARELAGNLGERQLKLTGSLFGESLCPTVPPEERPALKFRQFLEAFPDIVQVFKGPSGDMVRLLKRQV